MKNHISYDWLNSYSSILTLSCPAFSVVRHARGGSEARMPKIKVNINGLKWNFAWVIIAIKAFLLQNLRVIEGNESSNSAIYPRKTGWTFKKKKSFYVQNRSPRPKIDPPCQFQQFSSREKFFSFSKFLGRLDEKRAAVTPWLINFAKIWSERVLRIKTKSHQVWAS